MRDRKHSNEREQHRREPHEGDEREGRARRRVEERATFYGFSDCPPRARMEVDGDPWAEAIIERKARQAQIERFIDERERERVHSRVTQEEVTDLMRTTRAAGKGHMLFTVFAQFHRMRETPEGPALRDEVELFNMLRNAYREIKGKDFLSPPQRSKGAD